MYHQFWCQTSVESLNIVVVVVVAHTAERQKTVKIYMENYLKIAFLSTSKSNFINQLIKLIETTSKYRKRRYRHVASQQAFGVWHENPMNVWQRFRRSGMEVNECRKIFSHLAKFTIEINIECLRQSTVLCATLDTLVMLAHLFIFQRCNVNWISVLLENISKSILKRSKESASVSSLEWLNACYMRTMRCARAHSIHTFFGVVRRLTSFFFVRLIRSSFKCYWTKNMTTFGDWIGCCAVDGVSGRPQTQKFIVFIFCVVRWHPTCNFDDSFKQPRDKLHKYLLFAMMALFVVVVEKV